MADSSSSSTIPPALAFLVSNFHSLVNIKLDSGNYLLWKTQVVNAFRANGYVGFLDGSTQCPSSTTRDSSNNTVVNPEYTKWMLINNQLLSCLTASLSSTTLPHVLGLELVSQVWFSLAQRFNSLSKARIHELKNRLYNASKTGSMDSYIDEIRGHAQRLEAVGHHVDDDDLVFYTLNGLPEEEFKQLRTAIGARGGDISFDELTTILYSEESRIHKDASTSAKVFVAASKMPELPKTQIIDTNVSSGVPFYSGSSGVSSSHAQMFQPVNGPGLFYPQTFPKSHRSNNYDGGFNRNRGGRSFGLGNSQRPECQICGRDNHTALYCYYRQNLQYQPPPNVQFQSSSTPFVFGRSGSSPWFGNQRGYSAFPQLNYAAPPQNTAMRHNGYNVFNGQIGASHGQFGASNGQFGGSNGPYNGQSSSQFPRTAVSSPFTPSVANMVSHGGYQGIQSVSSETSSAVNPNWYFDSGASAHVTNDLTNLQIHQPSHVGEGVVVGNGTSLPVPYTGQSHSPSSSQGAMPSGFVPNSDLL